MSFMGFENFQNFAQNPNVLAYGFSENHYFATKTDRNSLFYGRDPYILDWLWSHI
jgi:hypothetical protein